MKNNNLSLKTINDFLDGVIEQSEPTRLITDLNFKGKEELKKAGWKIESETNVINWVRTK